MDKKKALRQEYKARRSALSLNFCNENSISINQKLCELPEYQKAKTIFAYLAMPVEPNIDEFIQIALKNSKKIYVPKCFGGGQMKAIAINSLNDFAYSKLGIREPKGTEEATPVELDLILVPGVVFDVYGGRIGMGAGYYDRFIADVATEKLVGIAWNFQVVSEAVPMDVNDRYVKKIVTEQRIYALDQERRGDSAN